MLVPVAVATGITEVLGYRVIRWQESASGAMKESVLVAIVAGNLATQGFIKGE